MPRSLLVMGDCVPGLDLALEHRRLWAASEPLENTLRAVPRAWLAVDADDAPVPAPLGDAGRLVEGAIHVRDRQLPRVRKRDDARLADFEQRPAGAGRYFAVAFGFCSTG